MRPAVLRGPRAVVSGARGSGHRARAVRPGVPRGREVARGADLPARRVRGRARRGRGVPGRGGALPQPRRRRDGGAFRRRAQRHHRAAFLHSAQRRGRAREVRVGLRRAGGGGGGGGRPLAARRNRDRNRDRSRNRRRAKLDDPRLRGSLDELRGFAPRRALRTRRAPRASPPRDGKKYGSVARFIVVLRARGGSRRASDPRRAPSRRVRGCRAVLLRQDGLRGARVRRVRGARRSVVRRRRDGRGARTFVRARPARLGRRADAVRPRGGHARGDRKQRQSRFRLQGEPRTTHQAHRRGGRADARARRGGRKSHRDGARAPGRPGGARRDDRVFVRALRADRGVPARRGHVPRARAESPPRRGRRHRGTAGARGGEAAPRRAGPRPARALPRRVGGGARRRLGRRRELRERN